MPIIFQKAHINWANDFTSLYRTMKERKLSSEEYNRYKMYLELMPYLCTKIAIKDLDASKFTTEADAKAMTAQTAALIQALQNEPKTK